MVTMATKFERKMIKPQFYIGKNKNVDIKFSAHDAFLEKPSSGTLKIEILGSQII
jgi:hypothetical protein